MSERKLYSDNLFEYEWKTGTNRRIGNVISDIRAEMLEAFSLGNELKAFIGSDSEKMSKNSKMRRYCLNLTLKHGEFTKIFYTTRNEKNNLPLKSRLHYEACGSLKLLKKLGSELFDLLVENGQGFELHVDINPDEQFGSNIAYEDTLEMFQKKKWKEYPFLLNVRFKPDAPYASKVGDRGCRGKFRAA